MSSFVIDTANAADAEFVRDSWRKSYKDSPRTSKWDHEPYAIMIASTMDRLIPRCRVVVARPVDWDNGIIGWVAAEQTDDKFLLHYTFVRPLFRGQGVMTALIAHLSPVGELVFTHLRPPYSNVLKRRGFTWQPETLQR